ncbi:Myb-like_DNA-binding domain-containing protein [Hexamita inflata]|uniref:Myb-like DNA-binding domain-containing protein n=1 Tax=Hexamita inflata TaxID=28002 RepID=A0AA86QZX8_9EUKA|nr:Myb-like DNA-binding domain-containing protein [Hexamita inflata]
MSSIVEMSIINIIITRTVRVFISHKHIILFYHNLQHSSKLEFTENIYLNRLSTLLFRLHQQDRIPFNNINQLYIITIIHFHSKIFVNKKLDVTGENQNPQWKNPWTVSEQNKLIKAVSKFGFKWSKIQIKLFPKRSPNQLRCKYTYLVGNRGYMENQFKEETQSEKEYSLEQFMNLEFGE